MINLNKLIFLFLISFSIKNKAIEYSKTYPFNVPHSLNLIADTAKLSGSIWISGAIGAVFGHYMHMKRYLKITHKEAIFGQLGVCIGFMSWYKCFCSNHIKLYRLIGRKTALDVVLSDNYTDMTAWIDLCYKKHITDTDKRGRTLLIHAVMNNKINSAEALIELGSDPLYKDVFGKSACDYAYENNNTEMSNLLIYRPGISTNEGAARIFKDRLNP